MHFVCCPFNHSEVQMKTVIEMNKSDLLEALKEFRATEVESQITDRYSCRYVDSHTACQVLGISDNTLYQYVKDGRIQAHRTGRKMSFQLSELLKADIKKGKHNINFSKS